MWPQEIGAFFVLVISAKYYDMAAKSGDFAERGIEYKVKSWQYSSSSLWIKGGGFAPGEDGGIEIGTEH